MPSIPLLLHGTAADSPAAEWSSAWWQWLSEVALPWWWRNGVDHLSGGFFERVTLEGQVVDEPRRTRVTARQIFVFCTAHRLGWSGPALEAIDHGLDFLLQRQRKRDGTFASAVDVTGSIVDDRFDLYEQAFALFALASAFRIHPDRIRLHEVAQELYLLLAEHWAHPLGGFHEGNPPSLPLRSNPHMHLLEATLAWSHAAPDHSKPAWRQRSDELVALCLRRFVDPASGVLREYFDGQWQKAPGPSGRVVEPGHHFEWAWLLQAWGACLPEGKASVTAGRLRMLGETHGIGVQGVAINELFDDLTVRDPAARLWPQTERIKAWSSAAGCASFDAGTRTKALGHLSRACEGLAQYVRSAPPGLWHEVMQPDGSLSTQPCRASSLYHIVSAIDVLHTLQSPGLPTISGDQ